MKTVPAVKPLNKTPSLKTVGLLGICVLALIITALSFARAPFMPRSSTLQPPLMAVSLAGTVFAHLTPTEAVLLTPEGFSLVLADSLQPISIDFSSGKEWPRVDLKNDSAVLSVNLIDNGKTYLSFYAHDGEMRLENSFLIINALLESSNGQPLSLNARLELSENGLDKKQ